MTENKCIYFFTQAYNAEKTIERTIKSVIQQSYTNIIYYIVDSASTDNTRKIIETYAKKDDRICPIYCNQNERWLLYDIIQKIIEENKEGYFAQIDADDEYISTFAEKVIHFLQENNLDIAACASSYIDGISNEDVSTIALKDHILVEGNQFQTEFPIYFKYFRDSWGKIFSLDVFKNINFEQYEKSIRRGSVSYICFDAIINSTKIGVYSECLHKYYVYKDSFERGTQSMKRILTPTLYQYYYDFLLKKCFDISEENKIFLSNSYCNSVCGKVQRLLKSELSHEEKIDAIDYIKNNTFTKIAIENGSSEKVKIIKKLLAGSYDERE